MLIYQAVVTALLAALLLNTLNNLRLMRRLHPPAASRIRAAGIDPGTGAQRGTDHRALRDLAGAAGLSALRGTGAG